MSECAAVGSNETGLQSNLCLQSTLTNVLVFITGSDCYHCLTTLCKGSLQKYTFFKNGKKGSLIALIKATKLH